MTAPARRASVDPALAHPLGTAETGEAADASRAAGRHAPVQRAGRPAAAPDGATHAAAPDGATNAAAPDGATNAAAPDGGTNAAAPDGATHAAAPPVPQTATPLSQPIYDALRRSITALDIYHPDTLLRMDERGLAERFGISRTPVRAAVHRLEQEGFVETLPRRGVFIRRRPLAEILEMLEMWAALEAAAARIACARAPEALLATLEEQVTGFSDGAGSRLSEYSEANIDFHRAVLALSANSVMIEAGDRLLDHLAAVRRRAMADPDRTERSLTDHSGIVAALRARQADLAARRVEAHTARLHAYLRRSWMRLTEEAPGEPLAPQMAEMAASRSHLRPPHDTEKTNGGSHGARIADRA
ncbi:MAG: FCD domain-containing protein [Pseudomonadota bacterium]